MKWSFAILIFSITQGGCVSSSIVSSSSTSDRLSFSEFNDAADNERATVVFQDDSILIVQHIRAYPDSTSWLDPATGVPHAIPTHAIKKIILRNRTVGALDGAGIGFLSGGAAGLLVAVPYVAANQRDEFAGIAYIAFPVIGGTAGLVAGIITGVVRGHSYEYEFVEAPEKP